MNSISSLSSSSWPDEQRMELSLSSSLLKALAQMEEIARTLIPENTAYTTALEKCPDLIDKESNRTRFLRFCNYDPAAAAKRLVGYWKLRLDTFGPDRFCRPVVDFSGNGALTDETVELLERGAGYLLPPNKDGAMVMWIEYSNTTKTNRKLGDPTAASKAQGLFLLAQLCSLPEASLKNGVLYVRFIRDQRHNPSPRMTHYLQRIGQDGFPFAFREIHALISPTDIPAKKRDWFGSRAISFWTELTRGPLAFMQRRVDFLPVERNDSPAMQRAKIGLALTERLGLLVGSLPTPAGGPWSYKRMMQELRSPQGLRVYSEIQQDPVIKTSAKDPSAKKKDLNGMKEIMNSPQGVSIYSDFKPPPGWTAANYVSALKKEEDDVGAHEQKNPLSVLADAAALVTSKDFESQCSVLSLVDQKFTDP